MTIVITYGASVVMLDCTLPNGQSVPPSNFIAIVAGCFPDARGYSATGKMTTGGTWHLTYLPNRRFRPVDAAEIQSLAATLTGLGHIVTAPTA